MLSFIYLKWMLTQQAPGLRGGCSVMGNFLATESVGSLLCKDWNHTWAKDRSERDGTRDPTKGHSFKDFNWN